MSWQDRDYAGDENQRPGFGKPGGDWGGLRPSFDNPMTWAVPIFRISGITVRVHIIFILFTIVELVKAGAEPNIGNGAPSNLTFAAIMTGGLFIIVLMHEFGHILACRWVGGQANEILMWPLGGLASCHPPHNWKAHMITVVGGPLVNVLFFLAMGPILAIKTGRWWEVVIPNPLSWMDGVYHLRGEWALYFLYCLNAMNLMLLAFNVLLPLFPFDGGRILQAALWSKLGYSKSMRIAVPIGYVGAIVLGAIGLITREGWLFAIALFGGITCYTTYKQVQWSDEMMGFENDEYAMSLHGGSAVEKEAAPRPAKPTREQRRAAKQAEVEQQELAEVDRILLKIAQSGMNSLNRNEKSLLERATQRKREQK